MSQTKKFPFPMPQKDIKDKPPERSYQLLQEWWESLKENTGDRAALRRATCLTEVFFIKAFNSLLNKLRNEGYAVSDYSLTKLAAISGLAAQIKTDTPEKLGYSFGSPTSGGKAPISELRIRNILARDDFEELFQLLRRAISIVNSKINISNLAAIIWNWKPMADKNPYDSRRILALDYYAAAPITTE